MPSATDTSPFFVIAGPTASGKSAVALEVARHCGAEIVGVDAYQCYRGLEVLTAAPTPEQCRMVPHHMTGCFDPSERISAGRFRDEALQRIRDIHRRGRPVLLVGGSGHYLEQIFRRNTEIIPPPDPSLRNHLENTPTPQLLEKLDQLDPVASRRIDRANRRRIVRAVEVCLLSGRPYSSLRDDWSDFPIPLPSSGVVLAPPRETLHERIAERTRSMLESGAIEEVRAIRNLASPTARKTLGFKEILDLLDGVIDQNACIEQIATRTRQYAKRQLTWFRNRTAFPQFTSRDAVLRAVLRIGFSWNARAFSSGCYSVK